MATDPKTFLPVSVSVRSHSRINPMGGSRIVVTIIIACDLYQGIEAPSGSIILSPQTYRSTCTSGHRGPPWSCYRERIGFVNHALALRGLLLGLELYLITGLNDGQSLFQTWRVTEAAVFVQHPGAAEIRLRCADRDKRKTNDSGRALD